MKEREEFFGKILNKMANVEVQVDLIEYEEEGVFYVYCPPLDLVGYGTTEAEAQASWETVLEEYFLYTLNKNSLKDDLEKRGWRVTKKNRQLKPPSFSWMLQHNQQLSEVYNNHNFQKITRPINVPLHYAIA